MLVMHSDGLHTRWAAGDVPLALWGEPAEAAQFLLRAQGKDNDDATVVVIGNART